MNIAWIIIGVIYLLFVTISFVLAYKSSKKQNLTEVQLEDLSIEPYKPMENVGFHVRTIVTNEKVTSETRSQVFVDIVNHFNKQISIFQDYINKTTLPKLQEYIDNTSRINTTGYISAGILSLVAAILAFLSAFLVI